MSVRFPTACAWFGVLLVLATSACAGSIKVVESAPDGGATPPPAPPTKVDLLLVVDNSSTMAYRQQILALALPDLVAGLALPPCVDDATGAPVAAQPQSPTEACPAGSRFAVPPILDMHIGLISSSLGTFGADGCPSVPPSECPNADTTPLDDQGHLVTRSSSCNTAGPVPTYQNEGFLDWDPSGRDTPAGESQLGSVGNGGLLGHLGDIVLGDGQEGCGFASQNEAWYRFLVDPAPYASIQLVNNVVQTAGTDEVLLQQRREFLRADSLLAIVVVTKKSDVSVKETSSYPLYLAPEIHLPLPRTECETKGPLDPCCASCGEATPAGCPDDPVCALPNDYYTYATENTALRAFGLISGKARYGIEFMYPPSRYVTALTSPTVTNETTGQELPSPIFSNLDPGGNPTARVRDPSLVFYAAIAGVPWQLVARQNASGEPDLIHGTDPLDPSQVGGFRTSKELERTDKAGNVLWDDIAGDPEQYVPAKSPFMVESTSPRVGVDPITGIAVSPPGSPADANPINGREWTPAQPAGDIEYACIFPIVDLSNGVPAPIDEGPSTGLTSGDCAGGWSDSPLCAPNPNDGMKNTLQVNAKAYPGIKHLAIARGLGTQGIVGSICPAQLTDATRPDFGYRPSMQAILTQLRRALHGP